MVTNFNSGWQINYCYGRTTIILITATLGLFSCSQGDKSTPQAVNREILKTTVNFENQTTQTIQSNQFIDTKFKYSDAIGKHLIIENSLPKGGLKYTDPNGMEYVYAVFWTLMTNETTDPVEFTIGFSSDSIEHPSSANNYFKLFIPSVKMTAEKESLFNYGLRELGPVLDSEFHKSSSLQQTINPKESSAFYVITLFKRGFNGTVRAGLSLKEQNLFYRINGKEIHCGQSNFKEYP